MCACVCVRASVPSSWTTTCHNPTTPPPHHPASTPAGGAGAVLGTDPLRRASVAVAHPLLHTPTPHNSLTPSPHVHPPWYSRAQSRTSPPLQEYLEELPVLTSMMRFANKRHRAVEMGRAGTVFCFGSNHHGQVNPPLALVLSHFPSPHSRTHPLHPNLHHAGHAPSPSCVPHCAQLWGLTACPRDCGVVAGARVSSGSWESAKSCLARTSRWS